MFAAARDLQQNLLFRNQLKRKTMSIPLTKKTSCHETFILPNQFETYSKKGYVIFMTQPTAFGTYKAVKITIVQLQKA